MQYYLLVREDKKNDLIELNTTLQAMYKTNKNAHPVLCHKKYHNLTIITNQILL